MFMARNKRGESDKNGLGISWEFLLLDPCILSTPRGPSSLTPPSTSPGPRRRRARSASRWTSPCRSPARDRRPWWASAQQVCVVSWLVNNITDMIWLSLSLSVNILSPLNKWNDHETQHVPPGPASQFLSPSYQANGSPSQNPNPSPQILDLTRPMALGWVLLC